MTIKATNPNSKFTYGTEKDREIMEEILAKAKRNERGNEIAMLKKNRP